MKPTTTIKVEIPTRLYEKLDTENININDVIVKALEKSIKRVFSEEELKTGYEEMGKINSEIAKVCLEADNDALSLGEQFLTECE